MNYILKASKLKDCIQAIITRRQSLKVSKVVRSFEQCEGASQKVFLEFLQETYPLEV